MVNYASPVINGLQWHFQYSNGKEAEYEGTSSTDRYMAIGATYTKDRYFIAVAADRLNTKSANFSSTNWKLDDAYKVLLGGHYKFERFTLYGTVQYLKNVAYIGGYSTKEFAPVSAEQKQDMVNKGFESWAFSSGVNVPIWGGFAKASLGYALGENQNMESHNKFTRINAGLGYQYPLSKRTSIYGIAGYFWQDADWQEKNIASREAIFGLMHRF